MTISEFSIRRPVFAWMLMTGLIVFGAVAFTRMGVSLLPDVDFPVITVSLNLQGAAPEVMETDVVDLVEDAVMSIEGVRTVTSSSREGMATVSIEFELSRNVDMALQDVQAKIAQVQRRLPRNMDPIAISKINPDDQPIMWLTLRSGKYPLKDLMAYVNDRVKDQFSTVAGVGDIMLGGYVDPNLRVWISNKALTRYNLTVTDVLNTIQSEHVEPPAGQIESGRKQYNVRTLGEATSAEEFGNIVINQRGGQPNYVPIRLNQVARIEEGLADIMRISRGMGVPAIGLGIIKQRGANTVEVAQGVRKKIAEVEKSLPPGMSMAVNFDSSEFVEQSVHELKRTLLLSAILTSLVCWMFLGSWSSTLNVLLAIPTSVVGSFIFLYFSGFTLNIFTLLGLSLSIGIVVDDAIMVLENIIRHQEMGEGRVSGAINGAREITFAAVAATAAIVAIFLPVVFMKGIIGQFFFQFGVTLTVAVLLSLVEALTLTPMRCSQFVTVGERRTRIGRAMENTIEATRRFYRWSLERALHHRIIVTTVSLAIFALSLLTIPAINKELIPPEDQSRLLVRLQTPVGSSISYTNEKFKEAEKFLAAQPEVLRYYAAVGGGGAGGQVNSGIIFITMKDRGQRGINPKAGHELSQQEFMAVCRNAFNKIPDVKAAVQDLSMRGFSSSRGFPVELTIQGPEWDQLGQYAQKIMQAMDKSGMVTDVDTDYQVGMPEIHIIPDREKAAAHGVSVTTIGDTVNAMIGGVVAGSYPKNGHRYDIRVKLEENTADKMNEIKKLYVRNNRGELIPLSEVVRVEQKPTLQVISRMNRARAITIFSNIKPGESQQKVLKAVNQMAQQILPPGYFVTPSGSAQGFSESFRSLMIALILGIFVSYMVLASQFNSFMHPITVLMALPFSISGALVALLLTGQSLNLYSMIGLILLLGIVKKNSILLVDFTNQIRDRGNISITDALLEACPIRLRPILMTSIATIAGALPAALALGAGSESRKPMAIAIIGGVLVSTLLTLYVVPVVYSLLAKENRHRIEAVESKEQKTRLAKSR